MAAEIGFKMCLDAGAVTDVGEHQTFLPGPTVIPVDESLHTLIAVKTYAFLRRFVDQLAFNGEWEIARPDAVGQDQ
jgi:hypothetical protein